MLLLRRTVVVFPLAAAALAFFLMGSASAKQSADAIARLRFMAGSWRCVVRGGVSNSEAFDLTYTFSPDGKWMEERQTGGDWEVQMWGFDSRKGKLVAYQFTPGGVFTKTVEGWVNGVFTSTRNDNGATVSMHPKNNGSFDWVVESADHAYIVTEVCRR